MGVWRRGWHSALPVWLLLYCWGCGGDGSTQNRPPLIQQGPTADRTTVGPGQEIAVSVAGSDPDGDPLTYAWSSTGGAFTQGAAAADAIWHAPDAIQGRSEAFMLTVAVADARGGSDSGAVGVVVLVNGPPAIDTGPTAARTILAAGESVNVSVAASDPDGDPLAYAWSATGGSFTAGQDASQATWRAPDTVEGNGQTFVLTVRVADDQGGVVEKPLDVTVRPVADLDAVIQ